MGRMAEEQDAFQQLTLSDFNGELKKRPKLKVLINPTIFDANWLYHNLDSSMLNYKGSLN